MENTNLTDKELNTGLTAQIDDTAEFVTDAEFEQFLQPLSAEEFNQLEENILRDGIQEPLKVWNGILIDGHNRYKIAEKHGLKFKVTTMNFDSRDDALIWVSKYQLGRRNINAYQRALLALKLKPIYAAKAKENQARKSVLANLPKQNSMDTRAILAGLAGVSPRTLAKVEKIQESASDEIKMALADNKISIDAAYNLMIQKQEQLEEVTDNARKHFELAKASARKAATWIKELGKLLILTKEKFSSQDEWQNWLKNHCDIDEKEANIFMDAVTEDDEYLAERILMNMPAVMLKMADASV